MDNSPKTAYEFGPITEKDHVVSVPGLGETDRKMLIVKDYEDTVTGLNKGLVPDPRVLIPEIRNMELFDDDIFICAYMKCGTHWMWEMCQMLVKSKADYHSKSKVSCMLEFHLPDEFKKLKRPRIFNTHLTPKCLPLQLFERKCKIIYLQRNPKDIITSMYYHMKATNVTMDSSATWESYLSDYILKNNRNVNSNWFYYTRTWSEFKTNTDHPILVLQYEEIKENTVNCLAKVAEFIGRPRDETLYKEIKEMCSLSKMKQMETERETDTALLKPHQISSLYRKGIVGDWKNQFTVAQSEQFDDLLKRNRTGKLL